MSEVPLYEWRLREARESARAEQGIRNGTHKLIFALNTPAADTRCTTFWDGPASGENLSHLCRLTILCAVFVVDIQLRSSLHFCFERAM